MTGNDIKSPHQDAAIEWAAEARIAKAGIRVSNERVRALGLLMKFDDRAWTVHELARLSAREEVEPPAMTRLYRSLHLLEEKGIVKREVHRTPGHPSFAFRLARPTCSLLLQCRVCNRLVATQSAELRAQVERTGLETGLAVSAREVQVLVTCRECGEREP